MAEQGALIAAIVVDPESHHAWDVYSDWLLDRGDPRGEWIRASLASDDERVAKHPPVDEESLLTPRLADHWHRLQLKWWRGFIRGASLTGAMDDPPTAETVDALFADPHSALLAYVGLVHPVTESVPLWQPLLARSRPSIRGFAATNLGAGAKQLDALPNLLSLDVNGLRETAFPGRRTRAPVDELAHASLRDLSAGGRSCPAASTGRFALPELELLVWDMVDGVDETGAYSTNVFTSRDSILNRPPPQLSKLTVTHTFAGATIAMLANCTVVRQLRHLVWMGGNDAAATIGELLGHAAAFRQLDGLTMSGSGQLSAANVAELRARLERALPNTKLDIAWNHLIARAPAPLPAAVDADSRDEDGRVNAIAKFTHRNPER